ncbi:MAG: lipoyl synthase [Clostridiales bacterium]|nr:lipoyl synthase [Clostridiales bacterium]
MEKNQSVSVDGGEAGSKPAWLKVKLPSERNFFQVAEILKANRLHTICQSARCPNISECWSARTATFLILGDVCTRDCSFCAVRKGGPKPSSAEEPGSVAKAVAAMGLDYAVITSVTRDDLADGGAGHIAATIRAIKTASPQIKVEVLVPDFKGNERALAAVVEAGPDVLNHNLETTESCYPLINRPPENYQRSLGVLKRARQMGALTKSGLMIGLGEDETEIVETLFDLRTAGCDLLTIGQYLRPSPSHAPVRKYYAPADFEEFRKKAKKLGFKGVEAGPLVRSSYQAHRMFNSLGKGANESRCVT